MCADTTKINDYNNNYYNNVAKNNSYPNNINDVVAKNHPVSGALSPIKMFKSGRSILGVHDTSGDLIALPPELESQNAELSSIALQQVRIEASIKTGCSFEALNRKSNKKRSALEVALDEDNNLDRLESAVSNGGDLGIEEHPLLPYTGGGKADQIVPDGKSLEALSDAELEALGLLDKKREKDKKQKEKQRKELANRLTNSPKFTPAAPSPRREYRYVAPPPKHHPPKLRPPGA